MILCRWKKAYNIWYDHIYMQNTYPKMCDSDTLCGRQYLSRSPGHKNLTDTELCQCVCCSASIPVPFLHIDAGRFDTICI